QHVLAGGGDADDATIEVREYREYRAMKLTRWSPASTDVPALSPPVTPDEERWWAQIRKPLRARLILRWGLPQFLVYVGAATYQHPEKFLHVSTLWFVPAMGLLAGFTSLGMWASSEKRQRDQEVRWKRIRETLLDDSSEP